MTRKFLSRPLAWVIPLLAFVPNGPIQWWLLLPILVVLVAVMNLLAASLDERGWPGQKRGG